jgi:4-hydroxy-tetrahydrodipicolinate synthase
MEAEILVPALAILSKDGGIDLDGNRAFLEYLNGFPIDGVVALGSAGEFFSFALQDKKAYLSLVLKEARGKALCGTGCPAMRETVDLSNWAIDSGAEGVLLIGQTYYPMDQEDVFLYYKGLADRIRGDVYLYNYPARAHMDIAPSTVRRIAEECENVVGMKESVPSFGHTRAVLDEVRGARSGFRVYSGFDDQFLDNTDYGGAGGIGGLANIVPGLWAEWAQSVRAGDREKAAGIKNRIFPLMRLYEMGTKTYGIFKHVLRRRGLSVSTASMFPFADPSEEDILAALSLVEEALGEGRDSSSELKK